MLVVTRVSKPGRSRLLGVSNVWRVQVKRRVHRNLTLLTIINHPGYDSPLKDFHSLVDGDGVGSHLHLQVPKQRLITDATWCNENGKKAYQTRCQYRL